MKNFLNLSLSLLLLLFCSHCIRSNEHTCHERVAYPNTCFDSVPSLTHVSSHCMKNWPINYTFSVGENAEDMYGMYQTELICTNITHQALNASNMVTYMRLLTEYDAKTVNIDEKLKLLLSDTDFQCQIHACGRVKSHNEVNPECTRWLIFSSINFTFDSCNEPSAPTSTNSYSTVETAATVTVNDTNNMSATTQSSRSLQLINTLSTTQNMSATTQSLRSLTTTTQSTSIVTQNMSATTLSMTSKNNPITTENLASGTINLAIVLGLLAVIFIGIMCISFITGFLFLYKQWSKGQYENGEEKELNLSRTINLDLKLSDNISMGSFNTTYQDLQLPHTEEMCNKDTKPTAKETTSSEEIDSCSSEPYITVSDPEVLSDINQNSFSDQQECSTGTSSIFNLQCSKTAFLLPSNSITLDDYISPTVEYLNMHP